ncbi:pheromone A receptor-domain-containing protein [Trametes polyzona]|nr:pheromone A receptor-domain-containing protein [Trametes polyzona]
MMDPSYPAFPILAFLGFLVVLVPLPWHLQAWNSGTCLFMFWTALASLNLFINSIVWHGNALNVAPAWCDISSRITIAGTVAIPAASLCINRRLYKIASVRTVALTRADKRQAVIGDICIGLGLPLLAVIMCNAMLGHRFDIYEDIGCQPAIYNTPLTFPLLLCWPIAIGAVSGVYCAMSLHAFNKRRAQFAEFLSSHSALTVTRYFRLMAIATTDLLCSVPISAYGIYLNIVDSEIHPWISWDDTHFQFWKVYQIPAVVWRMDRNTIISFELSRWLVPFCALLFFAFFGFAAEARTYYARLLQKPLALIGATKSEGRSYAHPGYASVCSPLSDLSHTLSRLKSLVVGQTRESSTSKSSGSIPVFYPRPPPPPFSGLSIDGSVMGDVEKSSPTLSYAPTYEVFTSEVPDTPRTSSTHCSVLYTSHAHHAV